MDKENRSGKKPIPQSSERDSVKRTKEIVDSFGGQIDRKKDRAGLKAIAGNTPSRRKRVTVEETRAPVVVETLPEVVELAIPEVIYTQAYIPTLEPIINTSSEPETLPVKLSYYKPDADKQPEFQTFARDMWGPSLLALEAVAHIESPVKNERSQVFLDREQKIKDSYLASHPQVSEEEYDAKRRTQWTEIKSRARKKGTDHFQDKRTKRYGIIDETPAKHLSRHLGLGTKSVEDIHNVIFPDVANPLRNEVQLTSISPSHDTLVYLSPGTDPVLREQIKHIYLNADISALIESVNPRNEAGRKLAMIQRLFDKELFEGMTGQTTPAAIRAVFNEETILQGVIGLTEGISEKDLKPGHHIKSRDLPMRVMQGTGIQMYTSANEKDVSASISKTLKKAVYRAQGHDKNDALDPTNDVTDTYRIKIAVMGGDEEIDTVMSKVLDILIDPKNKKHLLERDEYGRPIATNIDAEIVKDIDDDSQTNGTQDQTDDTVFRQRIQVQFRDLHHPVEIMFQTMEEFLRGEYNVGHYDENSGKYTGASHELYLLNRGKLAAGVLLDKSIYTGNIYQDLNGATKKAMDTTAKELRERDNEINSEGV